MAKSTQPFYKYLGSPAIYRSSDDYAFKSEEEFKTAGGNLFWQQPGFTQEAAGVYGNVEIMAQPTTPLATPPTVTPVPTPVLTPTPSAYTGVSIVDYLKSAGKPSDFTSRTALAQQYGIQNYTGTAEQNTQLLNLLKGGATPPAAGAPGAPVAPVVTPIVPPVAAPGVTAIETEPKLTKIVEMTQAGATWDEIMTYMQSQQEAEKPEEERRKEIYDKYGITNLETTAFQAPEKTFEDIYKQAYEQAGLGDIKVKLDAAQAEMDKTTADYNAGVAEINRNPWKSEAGRVGSVRRITESYNAEASRIQAKITTLSNSLETGKIQAENIATRTLSELEKGTVMAQEKLNYLIKRAEADLEAQKLTEKEVTTKELYRYFPEYIKNLQKGEQWSDAYFDAAGNLVQKNKKTGEVKVISTAKKVTETPEPEKVVVPKRDYADVSRALTSVGIPSKVSTSTGQIQKSYLDKLVAAGIPVETANGIWNAILDGNSFEEIRTYLKEQIGQETGYKLLDTFVQTLQGE